MSSCKCQRVRKKRSSFFKSEDERVLLLRGNQYSDDINFNEQQDEEGEEEEEEEETEWLEQTSSRKRKLPKRPGWRQVFTTQSNLGLLLYALMSMHNMAFDSQIPVLLHYPVRDIYSNPDVHLPLKFVSGFGVDAQKIGLYYTMLGTVGMFVQFLVFPFCAERYGSLACLRVASLVFPIVYFVTPFAVLVAPALRTSSIFAVMFVKLVATMFSFPCSVILLTNSASSRAILGTLNGVATSLSSIGRAIGPAIVGAAFSQGIKRGFLIVPWWLLAAIAAVSALPAFWTVEERHGLADEDSFDDDDDDDNDESHETYNDEVEDGFTAKGSDSIHGPTATVTESSSQPTN